jgi:DsbC/DsbD-like thiol-disulfide interchange protein
MSVPALFQSIVASPKLRLAIGAILSIAGAGAALAAVASQSPWLASSNSKVRLVSGVVELGGRPALLAGVQLRLDKGWKTYWRNPGDSGVPPSFDFAGSTNLEHAEVLYPAPHRFADANGVAIGYDDEVVFPVKLTPERDGEPIELKLAFNYGLCKTLCVPNDVSLGLALPADAAARPGDAALLEAALARVPKPSTAHGLPRIENVAADLDGPQPQILVDAVFAGKATGTDLFIDGGETYVPVPQPLGPVVDGRQRFAVTFSSVKEASAIKGKQLTLTLVSDQRSSETTWTADATSPFQGEGQAGMVPRKTGERSGEQ